MLILAFLKSLFTTPKFKNGDRVNHVPRGNMARTDGVVLVHGHNGVLVEFPRTGTELLPAAELCQIV